jgi:hypothetical protein
VNNEKKDFRNTCSVTWPRIKVDNESTGSQYRWNNLGRDNERTTGAEFILMSQNGYIYLMNTNKYIGCTWVKPDLILKLLITSSYQREELGR